MKRKLSEFLLILALILILSTGITFVHEYIHWIIFHNFGIDAKITVVTPLFGRTEANITEVVELLNANENAFWYMVSLHTMNEIMGYYFGFVILLLVTLWVLTIIFLSRFRKHGMEK